MSKLDTHPPTLPVGSQTNLRESGDFLAAAIFSLFIGVYAGLRSREIFEGVVYCLMFVSEAILAEAISKTLASYNMQQNLHRFALLFMLTALCSAVCGILKRIFGPKY